MKAREGIRSFAYGHDFGNSETCGVLLSGRNLHKIMIPSVWTSGSWKEVVNIAAASGQDAKDYLQPNHFHLHYVGKKNELIDEYFGQKVFDDRLPVSDSRGDMERYWRNNANLKSLMVGSSALVPDQTYALHVVTGVPVKYFSQEVCQSIEEALKGTYTFRVNNVDRTMMVLSVRVISEGAGALLAYGVNDGKDEGVIDIGGQTTDLYGARKQQPIAQMRNGKDRGVGHAIDLFNRKFKEEFGVELSLNLCRVIFAQHVKKQPYNTVRDVRRQNVKSQDLARLISEALRSVGTEIATFIEVAWRENAEIERALIVGGGAYYYKESILERIPYAKVAPEPEYANAMGYVTLAGRILAKVQPTEEMVG